MSPERITSRANPLIKELARLHKRRQREAAGRFLIEGTREVGLAIAGGVRIERLLVAPELANEPRRRFIDRVRADHDVVEIGAAAFKALSRRQHPDGIVAVAATPHGTPEDVELSRVPLLLVVEHVEKPGNLGAVIRTADGAGADAVFVADPVTDLQNPNVIRASQGSVFTVPTVATTTAAVIAYLETHGIALFGLAPDGRSDLWDVDLTGPVALAVGSEGGGLSSQIRVAGRVVRLPMHGIADSLNTSVAGAVALYEAVRQRSR